MALAFAPLTTDYRRNHREVRANPAAEGSPAHFAATLRGAAATHGGRAKAILYRRVEGFTVPVDGVWMVNGLWQPAGAVIDFEEGTEVTYLQAQQAPGDDRPVDPVAFIHQDPHARRHDPVSGKPVPGLPREFGRRLAAHRAKAKG